VLEFEGSCGTSWTPASGSSVAIEQSTPEYGVNQFEISLSPQSPVADDQLVLMRIIIRQDGRRYGLPRQPFARPFAGSVGSGSHHTFR